MGELISRYKEITATNRQRQLTAVHNSDIEEIAKTKTSQAISDTLFAKYSSLEIGYWGQLMAGDANAIYNRIMAGSA